MAEGIYAILFVNLHHLHVHLLVIILVAFADDFDFRHHLGVHRSHFFHGPRATRGERPEDDFDEHGDGDDGKREGETDAIEPVHEQQQPLGYPAEPPAEIHDAFELIALFQADGTKPAILARTGIHGVLVSFRLAREECGQVQQDGAFECLPIGLLLRGHEQLMRHQLLAGAFRYGHLRKEPAVSTRPHHVALALGVIVSRALAAKTHAAHAVILKPIGPYFVNTIG